MKEAAIRDMERNPRGPACHLPLPASQMVARLLSAQGEE